MTDTAPAQVDAPREPLLVNAREAARMLSLGKTKFYELHVSGRLPMPVRFGRAVRWRADELAAWVRSGCPERQRWELLSGGRSR